MPHASPELRRLRIKTGVKAGEWAQRVHVHRVSYAQVEGGRYPGSAELFSRCAALLTELLGEPVDADRLMVRAADPDDEDEHEHTDAGTGPPNRNDSTGPGRHNLKVAS